MSIPIISGVIAAVLHVVSGPDHLAAVTPIAIEAKRKVWRIGFFWGLGHLAGILVIGIFFLVFKDFFPLEQVSQYGEQLVAFVLIGVGLWALYKLFLQEKSSQQPSIYTDKDSYIYLHTNTVQKNTTPSFIIGIVHGLAGVAHFLLLLPALGFETIYQSIQYLIGFSFGTVLAMTVYTFMLGSIIKSSNKNTILLKIIRFVGGLFALIIGIYWLSLSY